MNDAPQFHTRDRDRVGFWEKMSLGSGTLPIFYGCAAIGMLSIRVVLGDSTALWAIAAIVVLRTYPINDARAYSTRDELEARRGEIT